ncbi:helix-turn-helix domain-containing protein [Amylibacter sp. SFDW26]|uniref:helix-turn-helix domain-containing protein n=1 Tax=Amylibacter sp. SFDW26 TaxID=2652722 RepID=UPI00126171A7|nr:helix-turn-helix domain-containing protein [Amylibacter sp. SFDW26]KAB7615481.1 helix-turn-helix domain-containing protein [Amylibacter sp. SFDW26]
MSSFNATMVLPFEAGENADLPALTVQAQAGVAPEYSIQLYRLFWNTQADIQVVLEGVEVTLPKGQLLTLSPGEVVVFDADTKVQSICFHHDFFCVRVMRDEVYCDGVVFNRLKGLPIVEFPQSEWPYLEGKFQELQAILRNIGPFSNDRAVSVIRSLLLHAADFKLNTMAKEQASHRRSFRQSPVVVAFQNLVEDTYAEHHDASFYSDALNLSTATLNRRVKDEMGKTIMQAVNERLALEARVALRSGNRSVKEVAFDLGFQDPLYFSRFFRKHFGKSPLHYFTGGQEVANA